MYVCVCVCGYEDTNIPPTPSLFKYLFLFSHCVIDLKAIHPFFFVQYVPNQPKEGEIRRESDVNPGGRLIAPFPAGPPFPLEDAPDVIKLPTPGRVLS